MGIDKIKVIDPDGHELVVDTLNKVNLEKYLKESLNISGSKDPVVTSTNYTTPVLTSNGTPYVDEFAVSASSEFSSDYVAYKAQTRLPLAVNGCWASANTVLPTEENPIYYNWYFKDHFKLQNVAFVNRLGNMNTPKDFIIQGSNDDGETWTDIQTVNNTNNTSGSVWFIQIDEEKQQFFKCIRLNITSHFSTQTYITIGAVVVNGQYAISGDKFIVDQVTSNTSRIADIDLVIDELRWLSDEPTSVEYTSPELNGSELPMISEYFIYSDARLRNAFNNIQQLTKYEGTYHTDHGATAESPIYIEMVFKNLFIMNKIKFVNRRDYADHQYSLKDYSIEASSDGIDWVELATKTNTNNTIGYTWIDEIDNTTMYHRYRIKITSTFGGYFTMDELIPSGIMIQRSALSDAVINNTNKISDISEIITSFTELDMPESIVGMMGDLEDLKWLVLPVEEEFITPELDGTEVVLESDYFVNCNVGPISSDYKIQNITKVDGTFHTHAYTATVTNPIYINMIFNKRFTMKSLEFMNRKDNPGNQYAIGSYSLEASTDNINWITLYSRTNTNNTMGYTWTDSISNEQAYHYYRLVITSTYGGYLSVDRINPVGTLYAEGTGILLKESVAELPIIKDNISSLQEEVSVVTPTGHLEPLVVPVLTADGEPFVDEYAVSSNPTHTGGNYEAWRMARDFNTDGGGDYSVIIYSDETSNFSLYFNTKVNLSEIIIKNPYQPGSTQSLKSFYIEITEDKENWIKVTDTLTNTKSGVAYEQWSIDLSDITNFYYGIRIVVLESGWPYYAGIDKILPVGARLVDASLEETVMPLKQLVTSNYYQIKDLEKIVQPKAFTILETSVDSTGMTNTVTVSENKLNIAETIVVDSYSEITTIPTGIAEIPHVDGSYLVIYNDTTNEYDTIPSEPLAYELRINPELTADGTANVDEYAVSTSSVHSAPYPAWGATGPSVTYWHTGNVNITKVSPVYYNFHYNTPQCIKRIEFKNRIDHSSTYAIRSFTLEASNDNETWTPIQEFTDVNVSSVVGHEWSVVVNNSENYLNYRLAISATNIAGYCCMAEIRPMTAHTSTNVSSISTLDIEGVRRYVTVGEAGVSVLEDYSTPFVAKLVIKDEKSVIVNSDVNSIYSTLTNSDIENIGNVASADISNGITEYDIIPEITSISESEYEVPTLTTNGTPYTDEYALTTTGSWSATHPLINATNPDPKIVTATEGNTVFPIDVVMVFENITNVTSINFVNRGDSLLPVQAIKNYSVSARVKDSETWVELTTGENTDNTPSGRWVVDLSTNQEYFNEYKFTILSIYTEINNSAVLGYMCPVCTTRYTLTSTSFKESAIYRLNSLEESHDSTTLSLENSIDEINSNMVIDLESGSGELTQVPYTSPKLMSNGIPYADEYAVAASSEYSAVYQAWKLTDTTVATADDSWSTIIGGSINETTPVYIYLYFKSLYTLESLEVINRNIVNLTPITAFTLQGSKTNVVGEEEWIDIQSYTNSNVTQSSVWSVDVDKENQSEYYGYRLKVTGTVRSDQCDCGAITPTGYHTRTLISVTDMVKINNNEIVELKQKLILLEARLAALENT